MRAFTVLSSLLVGGGVFAAPSLHRSSYAIKESHPVPPVWAQVSRASESQHLDLRIALKQHGYERLQDRLHAVADPDHPQYGQWLEQEEAHSLVAPHEETTSAVAAWLAEHGIKSWQQSPAGDWLYVRLPIGKVESMLRTEYHVYKHVESGNEVIRTPSYSLPAHLHRHIDLVAPTNYFGNIEAQKRSLKLVNADADPDCSYVPSNYKWGRPHGPPAQPLPVNLTGVCDPNAVTSLCLRTLYRTVNYVPQVPQQNLVSMTAYLNESANISDFHVFLSRQRQDASLDYTFSVESIDNGINNQDPEVEFYRVRDLEANLDSQTIGGIIYPTPFDVYSTGGSPPFIPDLNTPDDTNEPYLDWIQYMLAKPQSSLPKTVSTSYADDEQTVPYSYASRVCQEFAQLTSRGVTLLFSSGDSGVGSNGTCFTNDGNDTPQFLASFPASCPYVTAVGGTRNFQPEIVAYDVRNGYVSGSGVSNYFPRPKWQDRAVATYTAKIGDLHAGLYNTSGRAYPDITAQGFRYVVVYAGQNVFLDGTSCSTPTVTGVLSLVNDALIAAGRPTLGFINPWLYRYGWRAFTDVVNGTTWGCDTSGFPAKSGWDLASGWGTPDFLKLQQITLRGPPTGVFQRLS